MQQVLDYSHTIRIMTLSSVILEELFFYKSIKLIFLIPISVVRFLRSRLYSSSIWKGF